MYYRLCRSIILELWIFFYQQDGCGQHRAKSVAAFLETEKVEVLPWPTQSPDLNPIENVWGTMKRKLRELHTYLSTSDALSD